MKQPDPNPAFRGKRKPATAKPASPAKLAKILRPKPTAAHNKPNPEPAPAIAPDTEQAPLPSFSFSDGELIRAKAELCRKDFAFFLRDFWDDVVTEPLVDNWHIDYLCGVLQKVALQVAERRKKDKDIIINIPPGTSKSSITSIFFPVYCWLVDPTISFITGSHEQDLATRQSNASRQLMKSEKFKSYFPHIRFKDSQDNKTDYENSYGGYRLATSTGSSPTGRHALIIILDDPQQPDTAASEIERKNTNDWVSKTLSSRKANKEVAVMITVQQRLHLNDVTGFLTSSGKQFNHICLPAELNKTLSPASLKDKYYHGLLDRNRLKPEVLAEMKIDMGSRAYQCQMNQNPNDEENSILKEAWFNRIPLHAFNDLLRSSGAPVNFYLDTAFTKKNNRDPSAILACAKIDKNLYVRAVTAVRYEFPKLLPYIIQWTAEHGYTKRSRIVIEPKANGISIVQQLKAGTALNVMEGKSSKEDKKTRLNAISAIVESGKIILVDDASWNAKFLAEATSDEPTHDDMRDCFVAAVETELVKGLYRPHRFSFL